MPQERLAGLLCQLAGMVADLLRLIIRSSSSSYRYLLGRLFALAVLADELSTGRAQE
ncbi:hypothetical protein KUG02_01440 [Streptococcus equi subsp. zooepidemicus]|uniref:hypothetical protein n=1 Tax=Streptococcus equi TaxID=1336 RepID=UPI0004209A51|nr:hypothetical protein [Streptococcus equi]MCD3384823.1 hypothetical protein [Streptococcus equi subsp. zooepidemicus]MCD3393201.1 hypothetical protein [Streptococcus equi subsp. zooepidemicus]MCD3432444.1 hypothetical protein [Streptococcus equi subsp. zooepidemicus]HEK9108098.1 hypothetical protein [Streptococcus equi subsp. zooepidemicus]HEL0121692.1 hypothetical protein [Streptococcus equi subsp. zooepidemicus]